MSKQIDERDMPLARYHWQELLSALKHLGFVVKSVSFEERQNPKSGHEVALFAVLGSEE
jgi:signal recognition particle subunit SEC65